MTDDMELQMAMPIKCSTMRRWYKYIDYVGEHMYLLAAYLLILMLCIALHLMMLVIGATSIVFIISGGFTEPMMGGSLSGYIIAHYAWVAYISLLLSSIGQFLVLLSIGGVKLKIKCIED